MSPCITHRCVSHVAAAVMATLVPNVSPGQTETIRVDLKLCSGGKLSGLVVDYTSHGIVVVDDTTPHVFAWDDIKTPSAYTTLRDLKAFERGGSAKLTAEDHFELGLFALSRGRAGLASTEFGKASKLDESYKPRARRTFIEYRKKKKAQRAAHDDDKPLVDSPLVRSSVEETSPGLSKRVEGAFGGSGGSAMVEGVSAETRARVLEIYRSFGDTVRQEVDPNLTLLETEHFLIWTDWSKPRRAALADWCEAMYAALCEQFAFDPSETVFLAKCPVFCWRSKRRFRRFARLFDNFDATNTVGYTRSIEKNGHVHIVLLRRERSEADFARFACTLVHEGTHAFLHRLFSTRLIPHWVNEGYAELVAERVQGERCPNEENAALLSRQYVRYDWPIDDLLNRAGPIGVHQYPLAHSVVAYLERRDSKRFASFIRSLKAGQTAGAALETHYEGMTLNQLEARWRSAIRETNLRPKAPAPYEPE